MRVTSSPPPAPSGQGPHSSETAERLIQLLGLAISKIGVYGVRHPAAKRAVQEAYEVCTTAFPGEQELEFSTANRRLIFNAEPMESEAAALMAGHIERHRVSGFSLCMPMAPVEFEAFFGLLATPPFEMERSGGMAVLVEQAGLRNVRLSSTRYVRRSEQASPNTPPAGAASRLPKPFSGASTLKPRRTASASSADRVVDVSADVSLEDAIRALDGLSEDAVSSTSSRPSVRAAPSARRREGEAPRRTSASSDEASLQRLLQELRGILGILSESGRLVAGTEKPVIQGVQERLSGITNITLGRIDSLADDVASDRAVVARIEADARARGIVLRSSRDELLARLAELTQEILQPLTAASGVVEMLADGNLGSLTPPQTDMLKLAHESIGLVSTLAGYIKELVGDPAGLTPDRKVLDAAYQR